MSSGAVRTSPPRALLTKIARPTEAETIVESGDLDAGDGMRVMVMPHFVLIEIRVYERECELWVPLDLILDAVGRQHKVIGS